MPSFRSTNAAIYVKSADTILIFPLNFPNLLNIVLFAISIEMVELQQMKTIKIIH